MNGGSEEAIVMTIAIIVVLIAVVLSLAISIGLCYILYLCAKSIPESYRQVSPPQAFLFMIPCFGIIWTFIYLKQLSQDFQRFLGMSGQANDDCGEQIGLFVGISTVLSVIPYVGAIAGLASLVLWIIYLVKVWDCKKRAEMLAANMPTGGYAPVQQQEMRPPTDPNNPYAP